MLCNDKIIDLFDGIKVVNDTLVLDIVGGYSLGNKYVMDGYCDRGGINYKDSCILDSLGKKLHRFGFNERSIQTITRTSKYTLSWVLGDLVYLLKLDNKVHLLCLNSRVLLLNDIDVLARNMGILVDALNLISGHKELVSLLLDLLGFEILGYNDTMLVIANTKSVNNNSQHDNVVVLEFMGGKYNTKYILRMHRDINYYTDSEHNISRHMHLGLDLLSGKVVGIFNGILNKGCLDVVESDLVRYKPSITKIMSHVVDIDMDANRVKFYLLNKKARDNKGKLVLDVELSTLNSNAF